MKVQPTQPTQPTQPSCRVGHICNDALGEVKGAVSVRLGRQIVMNLSQGKDIEEVLQSLLRALGDPRAAGTKISA